MTVVATTTAILVVVQKSLSSCVESMRCLWLKPAARDLLKTMKKLNARHAVAVATDSCLPLKFRPEKNKNVY